MTPNGVEPFFPCLNSTMEVCHTSSEGLTSSAVLSCGAAQRPKQPGHQTWAACPAAWQQKRAPRAHPAECPHTGPFPPPAQGTLEALAHWGLW